MATIYDISDEIQAFFHQAEESGEDIDLDALKALEMKLDTKVSNCIAYMKNLRGEEEAYNTEIKRLTAKRNARANERKRLGEFVKERLGELKLKKMDLGVHKARIQNSPLSVQVIDENLVSDKFVEMVTKVNKAEILLWFKETGETPRGTEIAESTHLRID